MKLLTIILAVLLASLQGCSKQAPVLINQCNLDSLGGAANILGGVNFVADSGSKLKAAGWYANIPSGKVPKKVSLILISEDGGVFLQGAGSSGIERSDVAKVFNKESLVSSGYEIGFDLEPKLSSGMYTILLNGEFDNEVTACSTGRILKITGK